MPIVNGDEKEPDATKPDAVKKWKTHELDARVQIQLTLEEEQLTGVMSARDAKKTWDRILRRLQGEGKHSIALLIGELFRSTLSDESPLEPQLNTLLQLGYSLHSLGQKLDESLIAIAMIISLPDSYSTLRSILMATDLKLTTKSVKMSILQEELLRKGTSTSTALQARISKKTTKSQKVQGKCKGTNDKRERDKAGNRKQCGYAACGVKGHTKDECQKLKAVLDKFGHLKQKENKPSTGTITANAATTSNLSPNDPDDPIYLFATRDRDGEDLDVWAVDSGATEHMSCHREWFVSYRPLTIHKKV
jgi:hypothetical protein